LGSARRKLLWRQKAAITKQPQRRKQSSIVQTREGQKAERHRAAFEPEKVRPNAERFPKPGFEGGRGHAWRKPGRSERDGSSRSKKNR